MTTKFFDEFEKSLIEENINVDDFENFRKIVKYKFDQSIKHEYDMLWDLYKIYGKHDFMQAYIKSW